MKAAVQGALVFDGKADTIEQADLNTTTPICSSLLLTDSNP